MARQVRSVKFLPEIFQTPINEQFLSATLDQLIQNPQFTQTQGFIGRRVGPGVNANDKYVIEPTQVRTDYQLEPGVIQTDPNDTRRIVDAITYPGINDALKLQGAYTNDTNRLYTSDYYTWDPFVDFDKVVNYAQYYWLPTGPLSVDVSAFDVPLTDNFTVTRANGVYTFSGLTGNNPVVTLLQGGSYTFTVAQNQTETENFRVTNNNASSWNVDYVPNKTLQLIRGNTYVFNLSQSAPWAFYIKTEASLGTTNIYSAGVFNNGASTGLITFTVPLDAPDTLYYCNDTQFNLRGQLTIIDASPSAPGPGFWIQTDPGVAGQIPSSPNISSRDVLGVTNNGIDLGVITFDVPMATDQDFYYTMPSIGLLDLVTDLAFDQINGQRVTDFLNTYPGGIDGITNLQNRTLIFSTQDVSPTPANLYGVWRIQYLTDVDGEYMSLQYVQDVDLNNKFTIGFGAEYSNTNWYKNNIGYFSEMPLLTADKDLLFYQDGTDPEIFGQIRIVNPSLTATLDVDGIIGSATYTSPNGVTFTNGMKVIFRGSVVPVSYQNQEYYVEGVGSSIKLLSVKDFVTPEMYTQDATDPYDSTPYDQFNFDGSLNQPFVPDYLTINRASVDLNAWTRSNRWFHIDVIRQSAIYNNTVPVLDNNQRARRPILEYRAGTHLYNSGTQGVQPVDIIDFMQTDALSNVYGSIGYGTDGYTLIPGSTIIFANDLDLQVRNKIYTVEFVVIESATDPVIVLVPSPDGNVLVDQLTVGMNGLTQQGISYYFDGVYWIKAQQKISVNQPPLFDLYNSDGMSFGNQDIYPSSSFKGSSLFSYAIGDVAPDLVLGFPLTYLSLSNLGDIVFDNNFYKDTFTYTVDSEGQTLPLSTGFARQYSDRTTYTREIGWQPAVTPSLVRQQFQFTYDAGPILLDVAVNDNNTVPAIQIYINGRFQESYNYSYTVATNTTTINLLTTYVPGNLVEVSVLSDQISVAGFYKVPTNLNNNPLNGNSNQFTLGTIRNHYTSIAENLIELSGSVIGANNTRDLGNIVPYGLQILQQSSPLTLTGYFMREANYNIFASLAYNSSEYIKFKSQLLNAVTTFGISDYGNWTTAELLDAAIAQITTGKTNLNSFYWSDMLPTGTVFTSNSYTINPISTNRFNTVQTYSYIESNYLGLCVYVNKVLLTRNIGYMVSTEGPTLTISVPLTVGDVITINEYPSTTGNFVPNTPTKLGLYPKYEPKTFVDDSYVYPTPVIQGHDGSITVAFEDIRDQVLLEFETRIYNNLKNDGNPPPLVAEDVIPGYFRTTDYSQSEINQILGENFLAWVGANKLDYTSQTYIANDEFTYNYSQAGNKLNQEPLLGAWRGIYRYFYDTLSPDQTPWEMLGFGEMPVWWTGRYGHMPYTSDNLVLWGDLEAGLVADPVAPYIIPKYRRPGLTSVIPVDSQGQLLPPLSSVVGAYNPQGFVKSWQVGDGGPVEASWWSSSSYPFAVMRLLVLTRPAEFFSLFADRDLYRYSAEFDQYLYNGRYRIQPQNIQVYGNGTSKASYIDWIVDYNQQSGINNNSLTTDLANLDVRLCYRAASFLTQQTLSLFLEKGSPGSENTSVQVPAESYNLLLYKNQPFNRVNYSAVIVEVVDGGYSVYGYSSVDPYFDTLDSRVTGLTQTLSGGNISVTVPSQYSDNVVQIPYGYTFTNLASVVDFLLRYGEYLKSQGLTFAAQENGYTLNWTQMAQEFLYFADQGWSTGTIINLNPSATQLISFKAGATVDSIVTYTPENLLLDQNRQAFNVRDLLVFRQANTFTLNPAPDGNQTISYLQLQFTDYESMIVLDNRTIFNDLIYNTITAERQSRIRMTAATTTQWNGTLNAQGFILNQDNVVLWRPDTKYTKGDIVIYKNSYWQATNIVQPAPTFNYSDWYKSNYNLIEQGLLQNLATKADQLANSYDTQTANLNRDNDLLAYGLIGFKPRQYMANLNLSDTSQVNLYQQFIQTMGSRNATDLFTKVNFTKEQGQYNIYENWGILAGTYGANANRSWFEITLNESLLTGNPSTVQIIQPGDVSQANQQLFLSNLWAESYAIPTIDILPTTYTRDLDTALPSAGYVNINDVDITVFNLNDPTSISASLSTIGNGTKIWVAQENNYNWNIYQCSQVSGRLTQLIDNLDGTSRAQFSTTVDLDIGDSIIVRYFDSTVDGVYRVLSRPAIDAVIIQYAFTNSNQTSITGTGIVFYLQTMRVAQPSDIINLPYANQLVSGATAWVDNNTNGHWEVLEKTDPFVLSSTIVPQRFEANSRFGSSISQSNNHYALLIGAPDASNGRGLVYTYRNGANDTYIDNLALSLSATDVVGYGNSVDFGDRTWAVAGASISNSGAGYATVLYLIPGTNNYLTTQLLVAPDEDFGSTANFGKSVKISNNEQWMYVSAPGSNKIYAYNRIDIPEQRVAYTTDGSTVSFNYDDAIKISASEPEQLAVTINSIMQQYPADYTLSNGNVEFTSVPDSNNRVEIVRCREVKYIGDGSTTDFNLAQYLYTAADIDSFTVAVDDVLQRPYIDYTFDGMTTEVVFVTAPSLNAEIITQSAVAGAYWQYVATMTNVDLDANAGLGTSLTTDVVGRQILAGAPNDIAVDASGNSIADAGKVYAFDRSVVQYIINNTTQFVYDIPGPYVNVSVILNKQFLTNNEQYMNGQFRIVGSSVVLSSSVVLVPGDLLEIETNQFQLVQKITANTVRDRSEFGQSIDICSNSCSVYIGAPLDSVVTGVVQAGMVQRNVNQSRTYGIISSTISNPILVQGTTIRINNVEIAVPAAPNNTVQGLVNAISPVSYIDSKQYYTNDRVIYNSLVYVAITSSIGQLPTNSTFWKLSFFIPNAVATASANPTFIADGTTKIFDIGATYAGQTNPNTVVYVDTILQTLNGDYTYNATTEQIIFTLAPAVDTVITVVSGRMTVNVINLAAAEEFNKLTVLPGTTGTAFADLGFDTYAYTQSIVSPNPTQYAQFGASLNVNTGAVNLVVGSPNGDVYEPTTFDGGETYFDDRSTTVFGYTINSGVVFTFDFLPSIGGGISNPGKFVFGQQVYLSTVATGDRYGTAVNYRNNRLQVGAPGSDLGTNNENYGLVAIYDNPNNGPAWQVVYTQQPSVDVNLLNSVYTYNKLLNSDQTYFDFIDPLQGKILGVAQRNIDYTGAVDPAQYNIGTVHRTGTSWGSAHVGEIWWDTNSVRFIDANQDNIVYASKRWGQVFPGSTIDVYQWITSTTPPLGYTGAGTPLSTTSYSVYSSVDNQGIIVTNYYFWIRGISTVATQVGKTLSTSAIASYILNPLSSGLPYMAALSANSMALYNAKSLLSAADTILHVEYDRQAEGGANDIHTEYTFIADGKADAFLNPNLYRKFLDSLCGATVTGAAVPDPQLSLGMQFGVQFRPRQSMFTNRFRALQNYLSYVNQVLIQYPISTTRTFALLNSQEPIPSPASGAWNLTVANLEVLSYQDLLTVPTGYLYLVLTDSAYNGRWTIYQVDRNNILNQPTLILARVQNYDTPLYWSYVDWYQPGYNKSIQPAATVNNTAELQTLSLAAVPVGKSVEVATNAQDKFEIYKRTIAGWELVGLEDGTIQFSDVLWNYPLGGFGFDGQVFDSQFFDQAPVVETRQILRAINEELFVGDLLINRNRALMLMFHFIYTEFNSPDWLIKTSYINVDHVIRGLLPYELYQPDNQTFVLEYLNEVKPYHVQNLTFNLIYDGLDPYQGDLTDFDVPARWDTALDTPQFVSPILTPYTYSNSVIQSFASDTAPNNQIWLEKPWSDWYNNYLLEVQGVTVTNGGSGYTVPPAVEIAGICAVPAVMTAIVNSAGQVIAITINNPGVGYSTTPVITLVGGNGSGALAAPLMGNNLVRSVKTTIKYDRCEYESTVVEWQANVVYYQEELVRWNNRVWSANSTQATNIFITTDWTLVPANDLNAADRTMGYYTPTANMPGLSLPLLIDGISYPGVQVSAVGFDQNTGFDVGNFDINTFDNFSVDEVGRPTYDYGILDTLYSSAYTDLYLGIRATDINVAGGEYIDTFSSHAPQELVPGSEFDTLDFRVYTTPGSDWLGIGHGFPSGTRRYIFDPQNPVLNFQNILLNPMVVMLFNATTGLFIEPLSYDWANYELTVDPATASTTDILSVYVTGTGGGNQLLSASYLGSTMTNGNEIVIPFPTSNNPIPPVDSIYQFVIYNGEIPLEQGVDYNYEAFGNKTKITFDQTYDANDRINLTALGYGFDGTTYSWSLPVFETILVENSGQLVYPLTNNLPDSDNAVNLIVIVNGIRARPSEGIRYRGNGSTFNYTLPDRGGYSQALIADNDVTVYVNNQQQILNINFIVDAWDGSSARTITFLNSAPEPGAVILISVKTAAQYWVTDNQLIFQPSAGLRPIVGDVINIITWNDTDQQGILTQVFVGPTIEGTAIEQGYDMVRFDLAEENNTPGSFDFGIGNIVETNVFDIGTPIIDQNRILVTLNGRWLFAGIDFSIDGSAVVILGPAIPAQSVLVITSFIQNVVPGPMAFRIFQDMRGVQATYRITPDTTTVTTSAVTVTDDVISVANINALTEPNLEANVWGVITIGAERIMYRYRNTEAGTVSGLLRGTAGTSVIDHAVGATVYNLGRGNLLTEQYQNYTVSDSMLADGSTTEFVAVSITTEFEDSTIIDETVEVYVAGIRITTGFVFVSNNPVAIEFAEPPIAGVDVTILVRRGLTWYQQGINTASDGVPLQETNTPAARFLRGL